jgi:hypothetical protein
LVFALVGVFFQYIFEYVLGMFWVKAYFSSPRPPYKDHLDYHLLKHFNVKPTNIYD